MNPKDFQRSGAGRCIHVRGKDYWAFVPDPLPPKLPASWPLMRALSEADRALSELAGAGRLLPNPHLLIQPAVRREAVLSSRIEGTQASLSDLLYFEAGVVDEKRPDDVREVANYVAALQHGLARLDKLPLSGRLMRELHEKLMKGVRGDFATPGDFRRTQNWIGSPGCTLNNATFVPPPVPEMNSALADLERYIHADNQVPPLLRCAFLHYQFEAIHPFIDGNGRIGRLLMPLYLCAIGLLDQPLLYLSAYFEKHRDDYYRQLLSVSREGTWEAWAVFFLTGVAEQSREALETTKRLLAIRAEMQASVVGKRVPTAAVKLVDHLMENPVVSAVQLSKRWHLSYPAVAKGIRLLESKGWLREATGRPRGQLFVCDRIMAVINDQELTPTAKMKGRNR